MRTLEKISGMQDKSAWISIAFADPVVVENDPKFLGAIVDMVRCQAVDRVLVEFFINFFISDRPMILLLKCIIMSYHIDINKTAVQKIPECSPPPALETPVTINSTGFVFSYILEHDLT